MSKLDDALHEALSEEDAEFLARFEAEPGSLQQFFGIFQGPLAWFNILLLAVAVILGPTFLYCVWRFAAATELRPLMYWGAATVFCGTIVTVARLLFMMHVQTNRVLREIKRLELQVARLAARDAV